MGRFYCQARRFDAGILTDFKSNQRSPGGKRCPETAFCHFSNKAYPAENQKRAPSPSRDRARPALCVTTLLAAPSRETAPHGPPIRADGVTPIKRPHLLTRNTMKMKHLHGGCRAAHASAVHRNPTRLRRYKNQTGADFLWILMSRRLSAGGSKVIFAAAPGRLAPKRRLSWQGRGRLLVLINAECSIVTYHNTFFRFVNRYPGLFYW